MRVTDCPGCGGEHAHGFLNEQTQQWPPGAEPCRDGDCPWRHSCHYHDGTKVIAPGQMIW